MMTPARTPAPDLMALPHRPERDRRAWMLAAALALVLAAGGWLLGRCSVESGGSRAALAQADLERRHAALAREVERLRDALGDERLAHRMARAGAEHVRAELLAETDRVLALEHELRLHRALVAEGGELAPIDIASFEIVPRLDGSGIRFRLMLLRPSDPEDEISGRLELRVVGEHSGRVRVLRGEELALAEDGIPFRFRHYQNLGGEIELPVGFVPQGVEVVARAEDGVAFELERTFDWRLQEV